MSHKQLKICKPAAKWSWLLAALFCSHVLASQQPLVHVHSHTMTIDMAKDVVWYRGQVKAHKQYRYLTADSLKLTQQDSGQVKQMTALGDPAISTSSPPVGAKSVGQAQTIIYLPADNLVRYINKAKLQQNGNIFKGHLINYNTKTQIASSPGSPVHPTTITIPPYDN